MSTTRPSLDWARLTEQLPDALVCSDTQGVIVGWNGAAQALFGHTAAEALGQSLDLIIPERLRAAHWAGFDRALAQGRTVHGHGAILTRAVTRSGDTIYVEMSFAILTREDGQVTGAVSMARDATQRHQEQRELKARLAALEQAARP